MSTANRVTRLLLEARPSLGLVRCAALVRSLLPQIQQAAGDSPIEDEAILARLLAATGHGITITPYDSPMGDADRLDEARELLKAWSDGGFSSPTFNHPPPPSIADLLDDIDLAHEADVKRRRVIEVAPPAPRVTVTIHPPPGE